MGPRPRLEGRGRAAEGVRCAAGCARREVGLRPRALGQGGAALGLRGLPTPEDALETPQVLAWVTRLCEEESGIRREEEGAA